MTSYKFRCMDDDGRVFHAFSLSCSGDDEALTEGRSICEHNAVEIWDGDRLVARLPRSHAPRDA